MGSRTIALALFFVAAASLKPQAAAGGAAAKAEEIQRFQGTWFVASIDICERRSNPEQETKFVVAGETLTIAAERGEASTLKLDIDPTKTPKELDLIVTIDGVKQVRRAIYEVERESLKICFGAIDGLERPRDFTTVRRPYVVVVLRRAAE